MSLGKTRHQEASIGVEARSPNLDFRVVAILAAYNEEDIIGQVLEYLIDQGIVIYFIDHCSTDDTGRIAKQHLGKGVIQLERFPDRSSSLAPGTFAWEEILRRKEQLARELDAHWFIHHDADEFRESPWLDRNLRDAIRTVDRLGYSAIDFEVLNFPPTHDRFCAGDDVRAAFQYFESAGAFDRLQIKCWKKTADPVDLVSLGGHDATFPGRNVFPLRFVLRHYPIRGQTHGRRKVFNERRGRFDPSEKARGWHVQYDDIPDHHSFLRDPSTLTRYDADTVRLKLVLHHRGVEQIEDARRNAERQVAGLEDARRRAEQQVATLEDGKLDAERRAAVLEAANGERQRDVERAASQIQELRDQLDGRGRELEWLRNQMDAQRREIERLGSDAGAHARDVDWLHGQLDAQRREIEALRSDIQAGHAEGSWLREQIDAGTRETQRLSADRNARADALASAELNLVALRTELLGAQERVRALTVDLAAVRQRVDDLLASASWRLTRPLRAAKDILLRVQRRSGPL
jgi:hypothetical protein